MSNAYLWIKAIKLFNKIQFLFGHKFQAHSAAVLEYFVHLGHSVQLHSWGQALEFTDWECNDQILLLAGVFPVIWF